MTIELNGSVCEDNICSHRKECANHETAGDFRSEGGDRPNVRITSHGVLLCDRTITDGTGAVYLDNGKLRIHTGVYPGDDYEAPYQPKLSSCGFCDYMKARR